MQTRSRLLAMLSAALMAAWGAGLTGCYQNSDTTAADPRAQGLMPHPLAEPDPTILAAKSGSTARPTPPTPVRPTTPPPGTATTSTATGPTSTATRPQPETGPAGTTPAPETAPADTAPLPETAPAATAPLPDTWAVTTAPAPVTRPAASRPAPATAASAPRTDDERHNVAVATIDVLKIALDLFEMQTGRYPTTAEGLAALTKSPDDVKKDWHGPYLEKLPVDPWGHPFIYRGPGAGNPKSFDLLSTGPDAKEGTPDDITKTTEMKASTTPPASPADARRAVMSQLQNIKTALDTIEIDIGRYPTTAEGLDALMKAPASVKAADWSGPYLSRLSADPWGHPYVYRGPDSAGKVEVLSAGPDGKIGTADDISISTTSQMSPTTKASPTVSPPSK